jgi:excisionase family DNA binding protein
MPDDDYLADKSRTEIADSSARIHDLPADRVLTIREFCKRYKRSRSRAYQLIQSGELLAVKDGRSTLIPVDAAEAWIRKLPKV